MAKRKTSFKIKQLVSRAKLATGNTKLGLDRMPKKHWMRTDAAKAMKKRRVDKFGKIAKGTRW